MAAEFQQHETLYAELFAVPPVLKLMKEAAVAAMDDWYVSCANHYRLPNKTAVIEKFAGKPAPAKMIEGAGSPAMRKVAEEFDEVAQGLDDAVKQVKAAARLP